MLQIQNMNQLISLLKTFGLSEKFIHSVLDSKKYHRIMNDIYIDPQNPVAKTLYEEYYLPFYKIGMLCGVSEATAKKYCTKWGVISMGHQRGRNRYVDNFFSYIDTPEKAYFLGFWFADGSVVKHKTSYVVSLTITHTDRYLIEKFLEISKIKTPIYITHPTDKNPRCQINIGSKRMYDDLINLGCVPNKSYQEHLTIPEIPDHLKSHFIRGCFDGDGIAYKDLRLGFCGHYDILKWIYDELDKILDNNKISITFNKSNSIFYMIFNKTEHVKKIIQYMYNNANDLYLTRKYNLYRPLL